MSSMALAMVSPAIAQSGDKFEEIVVTASRVPTRLREVGTSISVVSEDEIKALGFNTLQDVLRTTPSVAVSNTGGVGATSSLRIRGEEGFRTRTYIDGIDVSDTSGPQHGPRFEHILSSGVSRVEILRGPQGLMYGADAGGIVNIQTRPQREAFGGTLNAETGRFGMRQLSAAVGGTSGSVNYGFHALDYSTDGFNARTDDTGLRDDDGYDNTTLHGTVAWDVTDNLRLDAALRDTRSDGGFDNCFTASFSRSDACNSEFDQTAWRVGAALDLGASTHQLAYSANQIDRDFLTEGVSTFAAAGEIERISYVGTIAPMDALSMVFGFDLLSEEFDSGSPASERDQNGYYLELQGKPAKRLFVTAGVRYDDNDDFGEHVTYRVSGAYLLPVTTGELKLRGAYGTGFRAPSLFEVNFNRGARPPAGDVMLSEERSEGFDLGLVWSASDGRYAEITYFFQTVTDEIFFDPVTFSGYLQGDGDFDSSGVELVGSLPLPGRFMLSGNYTFNDTERADGSARFRRPEHLANLNLQWRSADERLRLGLQLRGSYDAVDTDGSALEDYEVLTLNANWAVMPRFDLYGRVENLLDEEYEEVPGFNTAGTALYVGLRYEL